MKTALTVREPLRLPDQRRPGATPSLPEWVASRIAFLKENWQNGSTVMTLPANMILPEADKRAISLHLTKMGELFTQTAANSADREAELLVLVTKMMKVLPAQKSDAIGYEARGEAYLAALDDIPVWAVSEAVRRWYRGECGGNYDYHWAPLPPELRAVSQIEVFRMKSHLRRLRDLANAVSLIEYSDKHREKMLKKLSVLFKKTGDEIGNNGGKAEEARARAKRIMQQAADRQSADSHAG